MDASIKVRRYDGIHEIPALNDVDAGYFENFINIICDIYYKNNYLMLRRLQRVYPSPYFLASTVIIMQGVFVSPMSSYTFRYLILGGVESTLTLLVSAFHPNF